MPPTHVLVPLDGSEFATEALDHALETFDCRVTVLNVVTPLDGGMSEGSAFVLDREQFADADERTAKLVEASRRRVGAADRTVETVVESGEPSAEILSYADSHDVDHIVMGGHGEGGGELERRLQGTVSTAVIGGASIPVTVVR